VKGLLENAERKRLGQMSEPERVLAANMPGLLAINQLAEWYERQWAAARDFKEELIDLLDASKFGRKAYTPYQTAVKNLDAGISSASQDNGKAPEHVQTSDSLKSKSLVRREDLKLICFDYVW